MKALICSIAGALLLLACSSKAPDQERRRVSVSAAPPAAHPVQWSVKALELNQLSEVEAEMVKPFEDPVPVRRGQEKSAATNCSSGLELLAQHYEPALDRDFQVLKAMALRCLALKALRGAVPPVKSNLADFRLDGGALAYLPPALSLAVSNEQLKRRQEAQDKRLSWSQLDPAATAEAESEDTLRVRGPGWEQRLQVVGRGDFDGDGLEDWLIQDEGWMTQGTYRSVRLLLLTRVAQGEQLRVIRELLP